MPEILSDNGHSCLPLNPPNVLSWPSHSAHDITYGSPPVQNRLIADRGTRLALLTLVNLRETFEEGPRFRLQSETVQAPQDSRDPQMIVIAGRKPDSPPDRKISSAGDRDLLA